jgi:hypothetical protein
MVSKKFPKLFIDFATGNKLRKLICAIGSVEIGKGLEAKSKEGRIRVVN